MARMWINNLAPDVTEAELADFLRRYGFPPHASSEVVGAGDGGRRAMVVTFSGVDEETLRQLQPRVHGVFFRGTTLHVQVAPPARRA